ncbi:GNAT family N-acetyltransferase [Spirochaeta isovalerica]|uniref:RimJ/RimL family protein N-acetyltransferase n=1 Tax=Spirochaeta isovalerica TaxID=150 RepID=A0A841R665_9SPIO|nr:GNAT family N-acetyltransferase [Spirochaeta isovalerica]MBB6479326.1 RimJ/RimL family protein N-acetyltransferase [Spirochaeta isovalerica]
MIIETERLILRQFTIDDLKALAPILADREVMRFSLNGPYSREKTEQFIRRCLDNYLKRGTGLLALIHKGDDKLIGYCGIVIQEIDGEELPEVGYRLDPSYWGRGLATEAAAAAADYGFYNLGFPCLISIIEEENTASIRVAEKNGFVYGKDAVFMGQVPVRIYSKRLKEPAR